MAEPKRRQLQAYDPALAADPPPIPGMTFLWPGGEQSNLPMPAETPQQLIDTLRSQGDPNSRALAWLMEQQIGSTSGGNPGHFHLVGAPGPLTFHPETGEIVLVESLAAERTQRTFEDAGRLARKAEPEAPEAKSPHAARSES